MQKMIYHLGVDIGSTTIKFVVLDEKERIIFKDYFRHLSDPSTAFLQEIQKILAIIDGREFSLILTGSAGFGFAERMGVRMYKRLLLVARRFVLCCPKRKQQLN